MSLKQKSQPSADAPAAAAPSAPSRRGAALAALALVAATAAVYGQVLRHDFVDHDDRLYVTENALVLDGLTPASAAAAFSATTEANWHPLTWLSHMLDVQLFGLGAAGHHATSVLLHIASTVLLFLVLRRMTSQLWPSAFVAALFALHPLHVESVAWVSERKDVLSTFFMMLTLWAYVRYVERRSLVSYVPVVLFFALGLMSKPMLVTLPFVLLLLDFWPLGRTRFWGTATTASPSSAGGFNSNNPRRPAALWRLVLEKLPLFVLAAASSVVTYLIQSGSGAARLNELVPLSTRIDNAVVSVGSYLAKTVWPQNLLFLYQYRQNLPPIEVTAGGLALLVLSALALWQARRRPYLLVGWLWFLGTLVPVIGLVQVGSQAMADRYTYIPLIGLFIAVAWGAAGLPASWKQRQRVLAVAGAAALAACAAVTWVQIGTWKNSVTLFEHAVKVDPFNTWARGRFGGALLEAGRLDEAIAELKTAIRLDQNLTPAYCNLGQAMIRKGDLQTAATSLTVALRQQPNYAKARNAYAMVLLLRGRPGEAIEHLELAVRLRPGFLEAYVNLARAYAEAGRFDQAVATAEKARDVARRERQPEQLPGIEARLESYRAGRAYPEAPLAPTGP